MPLEKMSKVGDFPYRLVDGSNSILQNATRWDVKRRVMQQEKVFLIRVSRDNYQTPGEA
jgi:hypothetical protein